jgi:hypothetical protein
VQIKETFRRPPGALQQFFGRTCLRILGWRVDEHYVTAPKYVMVAAPHTCNMDLFYMLFATMALRIPATWMMKDTAFWWPVGILWRKMGGIPINRRAATNVVDQIVQVFNSRDSLSLLIAPEGTRKAVKHWKLGFYWMALEAGVPVVVSYINHETRCMGVCDPIDLTGDIEIDFEAIRAAYKEKVDIYPDYDKSHAERKIRQREEAAEAEASSGNESQ